MFLVGYKSLKHWRRSDWRHGPVRNRCRWGQLIRPVISKHDTALPWVPCSLLCLLCVSVSSSLSSPSPALWLNQFIILGHFLFMDFFFLHMFWQGELNTFNEYSIFSFVIATATCYYGLPLPSHSSFETTRLRCCSLVSSLSSVL